jgi:hypothetical protein
VLTELIADYVQLLDRLEAMVTLLRQGLRVM